MNAATGHPLGHLSGYGTIVLAAVAVADEARASSLSALIALRGSGVRRIVMMAGDRRPVALRIGTELGLAPDEILAGMLPQDKVREVGELAAGGKVAFVGDSDNDAAALARADVGIAIGAAGFGGGAAGRRCRTSVGRHGTAGRRAPPRPPDIEDHPPEPRLRPRCHDGAGRRRPVLDLPLPLAMIGHEGGTALLVLNGLRLLSDPIHRTKHPSTGRALKSIAQPVRPTR